MERRRKIALSVDADLVRRADAEGRRIETSRSAVFERALIAYFAAEDRLHRSRRYVEAYAWHPEREPEVAEALALAKVALALEPWR